MKWDDQVALFELAFAEFGAVDIVVGQYLLLFRPNLKSLNSYCRVVQIPNAGIIDNTEVCQGNVQFVDGKPVAPNLLTLEVNLIGLFYSKRLTRSSHVHLVRPLACQPSTLGCTT